MFFCKYILTTVTYTHQKEKKKKRKQEKKNVVSIHRHIYVLVQITLTNMSKIKKLINTLKFDSSLFVGSFDEGSKKFYLILRQQLETLVKTMRELALKNVTQDQIRKSMKTYKKQKQKMTQAFLKDILKIIYATCTCHPKGVLELCCMALYVFLFKRTEWKTKINSKLSFNNTYYKKCNTYLKSTHNLKNKVKKTEAMKKLKEARMM